MTRLVEFPPLVVMPLNPEPPYDPETMCGICQQAPRRDGEPTCGGWDCRDAYDAARHDDERYERWADARLDPGQEPF